VYREKPLGRRGPGRENRRRINCPTTWPSPVRMRLTIRDGEEIARTGETVDRVYKSRTALGGGGLKAPDY
jgi:hypothetical protein